MGMMGRGPFFGGVWVARLVIGRPSWSVFRLRLMCAGCMMGEGDCVGGWSRDVRVLGCGENLR